MKEFWPNSDVKSSNGSIPRRSNLSTQAKAAASQARHSGGAQPPSMSVTGSRPSRPRRTDPAAPYAHLSLVLKTLWRVFLGIRQPFSPKQRQIKSMLSSRESLCCLSPKNIGVICRLSGWTSRRLRRGPGENGAPRGRGVRRWTRRQGCSAPAHARSGDLS